MKLFRRPGSESAGSSTAEQGAGGSVDAPVSLGKGRPTPKRREAESRRRGPALPPPTTQREAYKRSKLNRGPKLSKTDRRVDAKERRERMMAGDDRYVLPRDRGPARALARDVVDSRRNLIGLFMPLALVVVLSFFLTPQVQQAVSLGMFTMIVVMAVEGIFLARLVTGRVHERFPEEPAGTVRLGWYAFVRASQLRKLRAPRPRVHAGDAV